MGSPTFLIPHILPQIEGLSILDIGCGEGVYGFLLKTLWYQTLAYQKFPDRKVPKYLVGLDVRKNLAKSKIIQEVYDKFLPNPAPKLPFIDNSFDTILCIEVIEHLVKKEANKLLDEMDRVASKQIIISTPRDSLNKRFFGGEFAEITWPEPDQHKSQTTVAELKKRGYHLLYSPKYPINRQPIKLLKFLYLRFYPSFIAVKILNKGVSVASSKDQVSINDILAPGR